MGQVVPFTPSSGDEPEPPHKWFRRGAAVLGALVAMLGCAAALFTALVLLLGTVLGGAFLSLGPTAAYLGPAPILPGIVPFAALPAPTRAAYVATFVLEMAPALLVLRDLHALLRRFAEGRLLGAQNGRRMTRIALALAAYAVAPLCGHVLVALSGHGVDQAWFHASDVDALVLAGVLVLVARVMDAGYEAERDRDGFV